MHPAQLIDSLEPRRLFAYDVFGTGGHDTIEIDYSFADSKVHIYVNGADHATNDGLVNIHARGGNDTILVRTTPLNYNYVVNGEAGNDVLMNPGVSLNAYHASSFTFNGGADFDTAIADNTFDTWDGMPIEIFPDYIARDHHILFHTAAVERLEYLDSDQSNRIEFHANAYKQMTIAGYGGNDIITNVPAGGALSQLVPSLATEGTTINGGGGNDTLSLDDRGWAPVETRLLTIGDNTFQAKAGAVTSGMVEYDNFDRFDFIGSNLDDQVVLRNKSLVLPMHIDTGAGNDTTVCGGGDFDGSGLRVSNTTILGNAGNDAIVFDDRLDAEGETEVCTFDFFTFSKGGSGVTYSVEQQTLLTADRSIGAVAGNTVNINGMSGQITKTTIVGGTLRPNTINVGNGNLTNLSGAFLLLLDSAADTVNINDQTDLGFDNYHVTATQFRKFSGGSIFPIIDYGGVDFLTINGNLDGNNIVVESTSPGTALTINGGGGNDDAHVGNGTLAGIKGAVHFAGGAGTGDMLRISNVFDFESELIESTLTSNSFQVGSGPAQQFYSGVEQVELGMLSFAGTRVNVDSVTASVSVSGSSADDELTIKNLMGNVTFNGDDHATGGDSIVIDDSAKTTTDAYIFQGNTVHCSGGTLTLTGVERATVYGTSSHNDMRVDFTSMDVRLYGNAGNDSITVYDSTGFVTVNTGSEQPNPFSPMGDSISINNDSTSPGDVTGKVRIDEEDTIFHLQIFDGGILRIENNAVLRKAASENPFPMFLKGVIDLAGGALLYRADGLNNPFRQWLTTGHNGGAWNGTATTGAINSSLANSSPMGDCVGYGLGSQIGINTIGDFPINPNDVLLRHTFQGDVNLDGAVDITDLGILATNWQQSPSVFAQGDFNYDGGVDVTDLGMLATNWQQSISTAGSAARPSTFARRAIGMIDELSGQQAPSNNLRQ